jgi:hypothetical protein
LRRGKCDAVPRSGHYRVNFRDGDEGTACYAVDLEDAINADAAMAR